MLPNSVFGVSAALAKTTACVNVIDIAQHCPLDRMVLESDAPFLAGEPREIPRVAVKVAELKGVNAAKVLAATNRNCECFYNLCRSKSDDIERLPSLLSESEAPKEPYVVWSAPVCGTSPLR